MSENLGEIDKAMNLIKESILSELYESVSQQNKKNYYPGISSNNFSFSEKSTD